MIVAGKCPPNPTELAQASEQGFEYLELYLTKDHLDAFDQTVAHCRNAEVEIVSVHTPHIAADELEYFTRTNALAEEFDASVVVHTGQILVSDYEGVLEEVEFTVPHGFENQPGDSRVYLENCLLAKGRSMTLDVAHLYMATGADQFADDFEALLLENLEDIPIVHLCDSTLLNDGLAIGDGEMELEPVVRTLNKSYDGIVVLEVLPKDQADALDFYQSL